MNADNGEDSISHEAATPQSMDCVIAALAFVPWRSCVS